MTLSDGEKLIIVMLADLGKKVGVKGEVDPDFVTDAIFHGNLWALKWEYSGLFEAEETPDSTVKEVVDILDMWSFVEAGFRGLTPAEKQKLDRDVPYYGSNPQFTGFDGNNETEHLSAARFFIEKMNRWSEFNKRDLNSHSQSLPRHRRMLRVFTSKRPAIVSRTMSLAELIEVLNAP